MCGFFLFFFFLSKTKIQYDLAGLENDLWFWPRVSKRKKGMGG